MPRGSRYGGFFGGLKEAAGIDQATDWASGHTADTIVDWATEPVERIGNVLTGAGKGINALSDVAGRTGDFWQKKLDAAGAPSIVGSAVNFGTGGGLQWLGRSAGDLTKTAGMLGENVDTAIKGVATGAQFVDEHPEMARLAAGAGLTWAANNKMKIARGVGKSLLDEATDPAGIALAVATGGGSAALKGGLEIGAKTAAEAGLGAGVKAGAMEAGTALLRGGTKAAVEESAETITEAVGKSTVRSAARDIVQDTFTGRNLSAADTPGIMGKVDRAIEKTMFRPNPNGRLATFRAGQAEKIAGENGGIIREAVANRVRAGGGKPTYGGDAAVNAWRAKNVKSVLDKGDSVDDLASVAADPKGYAMSKVMGMGSDTASTGSVQDVTRSSSSITGDLVQPAGRVSYSNNYSPRGFTQPGILPSRGAKELTSGASETYETRDPYAQGSEYGQAETGLTVKDPYKSLTQPKKKPEGAVYA